MRHEVILIPCDCASCRPRMARIDRALAWLLASALLIAFASLILT